MTGRFSLVSLVMISVLVGNSTAWAASWLCTPTGKVGISVEHGINAARGYVLPPSGTIIVREWRNSDPSPLPGKEITHVAHRSGDPEPIAYFQYNQLYFSAIGVQSLFGVVDMYFNPKALVFSLVSSFQFNVLGDKTESHPFLEVGSCSLL